jgi:predicted outer membrane lipoprotein
MARHSDPSIEARGWDIPVDTRNNWLYGILSGADFVMLQTSLLAGSKDVALTISLLALAVALPMNILLVLLTYAKKKLPDKVRLLCFVCPAIAGTFIGIDAAFWHASWYLGVVFAVAMAIISAVALYTYHE